MAREVPWSYELPALGADASGMEEFSLETRDGEQVGTVASVVRRGDLTYLVFGHGHTPGGSFRALPWEHVAGVDTDAGVVELALTKAEVEEQALALDPRRRVEEGEADARRVDSRTAVPKYAPPGDEAGPRDRPIIYVAIACFAAGLLCLLALVVFLTEASGWWVILLALAAGAFVGAAGLLTMRLYRSPHERRR